MTLLQAVGALMFVALFVAAFIVMFVLEGDWKIPAIIFGAVVAVVAFIALASALLTGAIS